MSSVDLIGDTSHLTRHVVPFSAVHVCRGPAQTTHFSFVDLPGLHEYHSHAASAVLEGPVTCYAESPVAADKALTAHVAFVPSSYLYPDCFTASQQVLELPGNIRLCDSLYDRCAPATLIYAPEVVPQLKPAVISGSPPAVAVTYQLLGGAKNDEVRFIFTGKISVQGVGFRPTWPSQPAVRNPSNPAPPASAPAKP